MEIKGFSMKKLKILLTVIFCCVLLKCIFIDVGTSKTSIEAIEKVRSSVGTVVHEVETDKGKVVFLLRNMSNTKQISAEYVKKTYNGWRWGYGGGHTIPKYTGNNEEIIKENSWSYQYFHSTKGTQFESPFPFLFGVIKDDEIDSVSVHSHATVQSFRAQVANIEEYQLKIWYLFLTEEHGAQFDIIALTKNNLVYDSKSINEEHLSRTDSGTRIIE